MRSSDAASAGTVNRELVEDKPVLRPGEVLELVPGMIVTQHSGAGKANQYFLRGFNLDHGTDFLTTLDGVPLNLRTHSHGQGYTDLNVLIPELVSRVEYLKGPYFASKGDFASAGAADIRTADELPAAIAEVAGGSFGFARALFAGSPDLAGGKLLGALEAFHEDGPWVRPDDYRRLNALLRYSRPAGEARWSLTAMAYAGTWSATDQIPRVEPSWTTWLRTPLSLRYDRYRFAVESSEPRNSGSADAGIASPKASIVLGPFSRTELFLNWGLGFHSNDARGVTMTVDPKPPHDPVEPVTPLVRTRGDEVGVRTEILPGVQSSLALWELVMGSELLFTGDAGTTEPSRPSRRRGIEWSTRWQPRRWLILDLGLCLSRARFTAPDPADPALGPYIPGAIESSLSAGASIHELGPWSASVFLRYFGPRPLDENDLHRSPASTVVNARASYRAGRWIRFALEVFNLLDARVDDITYWYTSRVAPGAAAADDYHFHPAEPRSARATVSLEL